MRLLLRLRVWMLAKLWGKKSRHYIQAELKLALFTYRDDFSTCEDILREALEGGFWELAFDTLQAMVRFGELHFMRGREQQWECFEASLAMLDIFVETEKNLPDHKGWRPERFLALYDRAWDFTSSHAESEKDTAKLLLRPSPRIDREVSLCAA